MSLLARWCYERRRAVLTLWVVALVGLLGGVVLAGTAFTTSTALPHSESSNAYALLAQAGTGTGTTTGNIVWKTTGVGVDDATVRAQIGEMLTKVAAIPGVTSVVSPYTPAGAAQINTAASTAFATVTATSAVTGDIVRAVTDRYTSATLTVAAGGQAFSQNPTPSHGTEGIGILAALVLLFIAFRSKWAAVLPIITGVAGVGVSLLAVTLAAHLITLDSTSLTMAALIGLGVGIDYALFIVNRHRKALMSGKSVPEAIAQAVDTSGRAVIFAGLTVMVALIGMFVVKLGVLTGMGQGAALTVLVTVLAALTLLPALLGMIGTEVLSRAQRDQLARGATGVVEGRRESKGMRWSLTVQRHPRRLAVVALVILGTLAAPVLTMRVGNADSSSDKVGTPSRTYVDLMAPAFGAGVDATLVLAAKVPDAASAAAFTTLVGTLAAVDGVADARTAPVQAGQTVAVATVVPTTSAQTARTEDLVNNLRHDVIPAAEHGTGLQVYVGGQTATNIDMSQALLSKLPLYLGLIALLGFALLALAFRSLLVPLVGAISNITTIAVGLGVITAIFQHGWGSEVLGVGSGAPIMYIVPIILVGVVFGLSMDYQVFLVSRMHEEWTRTGDNHRAVRVGVAETARVIATAATIMLSVFASFAFGGERIVSAMGIGLGIAVLVDAFVVRMTLVPAIMHLIGKNNWFYPRWADRITPHLSVEGVVDDGPDELDELAAATVVAGAPREGTAP